MKRQEVQKQVAPRIWKIVDHDVMMILRKMMSPIPMYGKRKSTVDVPDYGNSTGYDMEAGDWVRPYGQGKKNDLIFLLTGYFNDFNDKDVTLTLSFSNPGDGIIVADPVPESQFTSPYAAPLTGYQAEKSWRLFRNPIGNDRIEQGNDGYDEREKIYLVRVRTVLDENGDVEKAYYGKICDGIFFEGNVGSGEMGKLRHSPVLRKSSKSCHANAASGTPPKRARWLPSDSRVPLPRSRLGWSCPSPDSGRRNLPLLQG